MKTTSVMGERHDHRRSRRAGWLAAAAMAALLAACEPQMAASLTEDVSTEADVRAKFGEPTKVTENPDGSRTLLYVRQPNAAGNYVMVIGSDGKMKSLRNLLTPENFRNVQPGMTKQQVQDTLGPVATYKRYDMQREEVWTYHWRESQADKLFEVTFDYDSGRVKTAVSRDDDRIQQSGGK